MAVSYTHLDTRTGDLSSLHVSNEKELMILEKSFCKLIKNVNGLIEDIRIQDEKEKRSQLRALQAQINPHFIFNAMDMVNWLSPVSYTHLEVYVPAVSDLDSARLRGNGAGRCHWILRIAWR